MIDYNIGKKQAAYFSTTNRLHLMNNQFLGPSNRLFNEYFKVSFLPYMLI